MTQALSPYTTPSGKRRTRSMISSQLTYPSVPARLRASIDTRGAALFHVRLFFSPRSALSDRIASRQQPNPVTQKTATQQWTRLLLTYARHKKLFVLRVEDADAAEGPWDEVLRNPRINRRIRPAHLAAILADMVHGTQAIYDPPNQTSAVLLFWRSPEEWAQVLYDWASSTGHLNTIMTFYEIVEPPVPSPLEGLPLPILRKAIAVLTKSARAQIIAVSDGEGVRFLTGNPGR